MRRDIAMALPCALAAVALGLTGCGSDGDEPQSTVRITNPMVTPDQELRDLQRALQAGAISPAEYDQQRRKMGL
ncbi:MAG TPA: SHOCT domain-containing protein [Alphaproteobacteria bacterium]|nr:SHOCT domain-containing protein [Alphaproteobacteria bacterium]